MWISKVGKSAKTCYQRILETFYNSLNVSVIQKNQEEQCIVAVIRHSWAAQRFVNVWEALPVRMTRQTQKMIKIYPIGWRCLGILHTILIIIDIYDMLSSAVCWNQTK